MNVTDIILHQWLSIPEYLHKMSKSMHIKSKKISNDQELIQSDPTSCPQNQTGNN